MEKDKAVKLFQDLGKLMKRHGIESVEARGGRVCFFRVQDGKSACSADTVDNDGNVKDMGYRG